MTNTLKNTSIKFTMLIFIGIIISISQQGYTNNISNKGANDLIFANSFEIPIVNNSFSFIVFGDLNTGGIACDVNDRFIRLVDDMVTRNADFYISTGDLIAGNGGTSCFNHDNQCPKFEADGVTLTGSSGNVSYQLERIKDVTPPVGLNASFFLASGNHDGGWGSNWYPDPCGDGICDLLDPYALVNHGDFLNTPGFFNHQLTHGDLCNKETRLDSGWDRDFFYSFSYKNSYFIFLNQNEDLAGMLNCGYGSQDAEGNVVEHADCPAYCSDENLYFDSARNNICSGVRVYDWLHSELLIAEQSAENIFIITHAPMVTFGGNHNAFFGAEKVRELLDQFSPKIYLNGHNHRYERTHSIKGDVIDNVSGTMYLTVGIAGAARDGGAPEEWFSDVDFRDFTSFGDAEGMTTYTLITVNGSEIIGKTYSLKKSLGVDGLVDEFTAASGPPLNSTQGSSSSLKQIGGK